MKKALEGIRVLDMTQFLAGPYAGMYLADFGAEVIKIENVNGGDTTRIARPIKNGVSGYYGNLNRGKKSVTVDLKSEGGKKLFTELVKTADVFLENNRPGVMKRLGFDYESMKKINPRIIYASISGFGQVGRYKDRPGFDLIAQGMSGAMSVTGFPNNPPTRGGVPAGDTIAGLNAVIGILAALQYRNTSGEGQMIDVSLVDSIVSTLCTYTMYYIFDGEIPARVGNRYLFTCPYNTFKAKDGYYNIACGNDGHFRKLSTLMGMPELADDPKFALRESRNKNADELEAIINNWSSNQLVNDVVSSVLNVGVPAGPIFDFKQLYEDPHIREDRKMFVKVKVPSADDTEIEITNNPIRMSGTEPGVMGPPPALGADNDDVFGALGFDKEALDKFREQGAI